MPIAVLVLALVAYGYVLLTMPESRRWGAILGLVAVLGLGTYFVLQSSESDRAAERIPATQITIDQVTLTQTARGVTLTGRVTNGSPDARLRDLTLTLRLRDCPTPETQPADCPVIGESRAISRPDAPPGQIRALSAHFVFSDLPPVAGTLRWDWSIAGTRATD